MQARASNAARCAKPFAHARNPAPCRKAIIAHAENDHGKHGRRDALLMGGAAMMAPWLVQHAASADGNDPVLRELGRVGVNNLSAFQRADQRKQMQTRIETILKEVLTGSDAPACVRLVFNDAGTFDYNTKTGGFDGSIVLSDELDRPENRELKGLVRKLADAKKRIDESAIADGQGPVSWSDLLYFAGKVTTQRQWGDIKRGRSTDKEKGDFIAAAFGAPWPAVFGRIDSTEAAPAGRIPQSDASVTEIRDYLLKLGAKPGDGSGPFSPKPPFWERPGFVMWTAAQLDQQAAEEYLANGDKVFADQKKSYDRSRSTISRTDYEVDFVTYYNRLTSLGAKFDPNAYLYPITVYAPKKL